MASSYKQTNAETSGLCCSICLEQFRDPRSLACLHTFCEECIHEFVSKQQTSRIIRNGIECPLCRKVTRVKDENIPPPMWSKIIPVNYALQDVIETLTKEISSKDKSTNEMCEIHCKQIEFFCNEEKSFCCSTCAINRLKEGKEVVEIKDIASIGTMEKQNLLQKQIYDLQSKLGNVKEFLSKKEMDLETQLKLVDSEMKLIQDKIIEKIEHSRALIISEAMCLKEKACQLYRKQGSMVEKYDSMLRNAKETLNTALQNKTPEQLFISSKKVEDTINDVQENISKQLAKISYLDIHLNIDEMVNVVLDENQLRLGEMTTTESTQATNDLKDHRKVKLKKLAVLDILTSTNEKQPLYSGMDFLPDGRLALIDNANWKLLILSKQLNVTCRHQFKSHIFDVAAASDYELYVTGAKRLEHFLIESERGFAGIETTALESCPFSISFFGKDKFVIGTYRSSTPVRILSKSGKESEFDIVFPEKQWKIDDSRCAYDTKDHVLVLTDRYDHIVYIYDIRTNHEIRVKNEKIVEPRGVAFGPFGCIFVCSRGTNSVIQLSKYGEVLGEHVLDMMYPCTISFSKDYKKVAVTNSYADAKQLQIFKISTIE